MMISRDKEPVVVNRDSVKAGQVFSPLRDNRLTTEHFAVLGILPETSRSYSIKLSQQVLTSTANLDRKVGLSGKWRVKVTLLPKDQQADMRIGEMATGDVFVTPTLDAAAPQLFFLCGHIDNDLTLIMNAATRELAAWPTNSATPARKVGRYSIQATVV